MSRTGTPQPSLAGTSVLVRLLSTRAAANREEKLRDSSSATAWLADQGLLPPDAELEKTDWQRLVDFRESLYALLLAPRRTWTEQTARLFNRTIRDAPLEVSVTLERTVRISSPRRTFGGAFGQIVSFVVHSYFEGRWKRFKTCANGECQKVFYDDSRSGTRRWCGRRCGAKIRARMRRSAVRHGRR